MKLKQFYNKKVKIVADNDLVFLGTVNDYFYPHDNENEKESIVVRFPFMATLECFSIILCPSIKQRSVGIVSQTVQIYNDSSVH